MGSLYLRNVPDEVAARLKVLAERAAMSVSAFAVRELSTISRRADSDRAARSCRRVFGFYSAPPRQACPAESRVDGVS